MCKLRFSHEFIMHVPKLLLGSEARGASIAIPKPPANDGFPVGCAEARGASVAVAQPQKSTRFLKPSRFGLLHSCLFLLLSLFVFATPLLAHATTAVGATPGSFKVNETGAATYTIPITVPPGTAGMAPTLSLNYNSQSGNGPLGVGWSLGGLSAITRCPASIVQDGFKGGINYDGNDRFCLDGQRLVLVAGSYGADGAEYRTETESYTRVISYGSAGSGPAWFKAWTKSGQIMEYGNTADSRIEAQGKPTVRVWAVDKISDTKSNYIAVSYTEDNANGEFNLSRIDYTGNAAAGVAPYASVQLSYEVRPDVSIGYEVGSVIKNTKRITDIKTFNSTTLIKDYQLFYEQSVASQRSQLISLTECASDGTCLTPTAIGWIQNTSGSYSVVGYTSSADKCLITCGQWQSGDVNGDGKTDFIHITTNPGNFITWLSKGDGSYNVVSYTSGGDTCLITCGHWQSGDVNGDGKTDFIHITTNPGNFITWLSKGDGSYNVVSYTSGGDTCLITCGQWQSGDVNGDGKTDFIHITTNPGNFITWLSKGDGTYNVVSYTSGGDTCLITCGQWQAGDVNGDAKTDFTHITTNPGNFITWLSKGDGSYNVVSYISGGDTCLITCGQWQAGDVNGDGKTDFIHITTNPGNFITWFALPAIVANDSISTISPGLGSSASITYKPLTDSTAYTKDTTSTYPYVDFQGPLYVVSQTQTSNGIGGNYATNYSYVGAKIHELGGGFLGFRQIAVNDPQTGITTTTSYSQNYPYQGLPQSVVKQAANGQILNSAQNTWQTTSLGGGSYHRSDVVQTNEQSWDLNGTAMPRTQTSTSYDAYGNATQIKVATDDGYNSTGPVSAYGNVKTTTNTYSNDTTNWLLGRLTRATVTSTLPTGLSATRTSAFAYDPSSGLLTQEIIEPDTASLKLTTAYTLDAFGNRVASSVSGVDIATRSSSTTYDAQGRFAIASSNALGHRETRTFEPGFGNPLSLTGPNGLTTTWAYDGFGRKIQENRADGTQSTYSFNFCSSNCPANGVYYTTSTASGAPASTVFFDSLNREIRKSTVGFDGRVASVDKVYNSLGQVASTSRPYFPTDTIAWTQFQYDPLGRTVKITEADGGVTQTNYNGLTISVTNPLNHTTQQVKNGLGQVVQTINARNKLMQFAFDPFGNPVKTLDPNGNTILLAYDIRGRKTAMTDPDMGNWTYAYDVLGEMLRQIDAKGQTTTVSYDLLGRVVKRQEPGQISAWTWDTAPKGIGKLAAETSDNGFARSYAYDNFGRLAQTTTSISGAGSYYQSTLYDAYGRVSSFTQPTGLSVVNVYNSYGYLSQVLDGSTQNPYWQAQQVDASGRIILERLGNNLYTQRSFDGMGRPTYISTGKFGVTPDIQNLTLNHDQNGNLISRDDYATQRGDSFVYDELDRLTVDLGPNGKILNYQYDELGNINFKTDVGSYFYDAKPHAVTRINGSVNTALQYDANGNQTLGLNNRTVAYTAFNLPSKIVQGVNTVTFDYDSNHERFRQTASNGTTIYLNPRMDLGGHFEQTTSGGVVENRHTVYAAGKAIAEVVTRGGVKQTRYFHTDHLGSIDAVTDDNAIVLARYAFDPFGNRTALYGSLNTINHGFTGHEQLPDVGLIHMNGRVYDPVLGRFLSADSSIQAPGNLQSYNRYSYVLNNPLAYTDPSGFSWFSSLFKSITKAITQVLQNPIVRIVATVAVAYFTGQYIGGYFASGAVGSGSSWAVSSVALNAAGQVSAYTLTTAGAALVGAGSGFAAGFIGSNGNFNTALQGAVLGGVAGAFSTWHTTQWQLTNPEYLTKNMLQRSVTNWDQIALKVTGEAITRGAAYAAFGKDFSAGLLSSLAPALSTELYNAYVPWNAQAFGPGGAGGLKDENGILVYRDINNFGTWIDKTSSLQSAGAEGGWFSRLMDGNIPGMDAISKVHDTWAAYSFKDSLCESDACVSTMLPAAGVSYGALYHYYRP